MALRDRDYMQDDDDGEERGRRYDDEVREAEFGSFRKKQQGQARKLVIIFLIAIAVLLAIAFLTSGK
jgi:hypothetical protein